MTVIKENRFTPSLDKNSFRAIIITYFEKQRREQVVFYESYRKLPDDERRRRTENEYVSELRTEKIWINAYPYK